MDEELVPKLARAKATARLRRKRVAGGAGGGRLRQKRAESRAVGGRPPEPPLRPARSHMPPRPVRLKVLVQQGARGKCWYWPIEL